MTSEQAQQIISLLTTLTTYMQALWNFAFVALVVGVICLLYWLFGKVFFGGV